MENNNVSFIAFEAQGTRLESSNKRLFILSVILIIALFVTNGLWVYYESQFVDEISVDQQVETGQGDAYINGIGDFNYGESASNNN